MLGYTEKEYIGHHISEFHVNPEKIEDILKRLSCNETLHQYESELRCKNGSVKTVHISSNVFWDDGKFIHTRCFTHRGILQIGGHEIPFITYNIREEKPIETGFNWFDICFYTAAIEHVFGAEYQTWTENPKVPKELRDFLRKTIKRLHKIYPFELAMLDFEVSGQYYLTDLQKPLTNNWTTSAFYIGQNNFEQIANENKRFVTKIEEF